MDTKLRSKRVVAMVYSTPLTLVTGLLDSYKIQDRTGEYAKDGQKDVNLKLTGITGVESETAYPYKTAVIPLKFSNSASSGWVLFEDSIAEVLGVGVDEASVDDLVGSVITLQKENHVFFTDKEGKEAKGDVWKLIKVGAKGKGKKKAATARDEALSLIAGKTKEEFESAVMDNPLIRKNTDLLSKILGGQFVTDEGITEVDGVYEVVEG